MFVDVDVRMSREFLQRERSKIVLWRQPIKTVHFFAAELLYEVSKVVRG